MAEEAKKTHTHKSWPRHAKGGGKKACSVEGCKRPYRAKSYCFFHYKKWRQGELPHSRYRTCSKSDCRVKTFKAGLCEKHYTETYKKEAPAAA
jgi:hypothetical protein